MWSDKETLHDFLGFSTYVEVLADICTQGRVAPLTLGIFGPWGSGKTSLMTMLQRRLAAQATTGGVKTIWFNAWRYEGRDEAQSALIHAIIAKLEEDKSLGQDVLDTLKQLKSSASVLKLAKVITKTGLTLSPDIEGFFSAFEKQNEKVSDTIERFDQQFADVLRHAKISHLVVFMNDQLGINSTQQFIEATTSTSFREQGEVWLKSLSERKRNPLEQTTIDTRRYAMDKWIYPFLAGRHLADINNRTLKELVEKMAPHLAAASIRDYLGIVKSVMASAINENGEELFPRKWNEEYIDAPVIEDQRQPTTTSEGVTTIVAKAKGQYQILYALLAGCGPLRAGEALGLEIDKHIFPDRRTLHIIQKAKRGDIQQYLKTKHGKRYVDLCAPLAAMLRDFIGTRTSGLLFQTSTGAQLLQANTLQDSLHPILKSMKHVQGGFNIFRRYRLSYIDKSDCPEALRHFWSGHAPRHVSERYIKLMNDRQYRLDWAERLGTGFQIPGSVGLPGLLRVVPKIA